MIRILNTPKFLRHTCFGSKKILMGRVEPMHHIHTYKPSDFVREENNYLKNLHKYFTPLIRYHSSEIDQGNTKDLVVKHDPIGKEFYIEVAGLGIARIQYERKDQLIILKHTKVPNKLGGRGIGKILAKEALEYVAKNDLRLDIQCSIVRNYVSKYEPKYIKYIQK